jgi:glutaredoxin
MSDNKFYVYSKDGCGFCDKLTNFMESKGVNFEKFNLHSDFTSEEFLYKFGRSSTFPQVVMDNMHLGGMKDTVRFLLENQMV